MHAHVKPQSQTPHHADAQHSEATNGNTTAPVANGNGSSDHTQAVADAEPAAVATSVAVSGVVAAPAKASNQLPSWIPGDEMLAAACGIPAFQPAESCPVDVTTYLEQIIIAVSNWCQVSDISRERIHKAGAPAC